MITAIIIVSFIALCYLLAWVLCRAAHNANGKAWRICNGIKLTSAAWPQDVLKKKYNKWEQRKKRK